MFSSKIESIEQQTSENEGVSPNPLKETNENAEGVNLSPQGASTNFQKFAAGAAFATPSGFAQDGSGSKKKPGRPRKHPKKNSSIAGHSRANENSSLDAQLTQTAPPEKKFVSLIEITAPGIRVLGAVAASHIGDKRWSLTKEESEDIAKSLDKVANEFIPDMENLDPKTAAVVGLGMTIVSIYVSKANLISSEKTVSAATAQPEPAPVAQPEPKAETVSFSSSIPSTDTMKNGLKFGMGPLG